MVASNKAIFLDRDGTLVHSYHYPSRPEHLRLYENIGPSLRHLQNLGFLLVIVTNQSGIARGYFSEADLQKMHSYLFFELAKCGVYPRAVYHCPHHPYGIRPELAVTCQCRKPEPGMIFQASSDLKINLCESWLVGDTHSDIEAGNRAGCRTILVDLGTQQAPNSLLSTPHFIAVDTQRALDIIIAKYDLPSTGNINK